MLFFDGILVRKGTQTCILVLLKTNYAPTRFLFKDFSWLQWWFSLSPHIGCFSIFDTFAVRYNLIHFCKRMPCPWGDFSLFCLDSMRSTISPQSLANFAEIKVSLSDRPWMSSYIIQCVSWLWTVLWPSSAYFPGELKWRWAIYSIMQVWSARNSNKAWWFGTNCQLSRGPQEFK
jgi:hypothetical protein